MDRVAVFVDAGYLFAQGSTLLSGSKLTRGRVTLNHDAAIATLSEFARNVSGLPLLRIYWYDGTSTGPSTQHITLAHHADVKMRLGFVNTFGQQKGVDSLIITDMIALARNRAIADAVLVSGDEDLRVGVQQAQEFGVRVHLVGIKPSRGSQSLFLLQESDTTHEWDEAVLGRFLVCDPPSDVDSAPVPVGFSAPEPSAGAKSPATAMFAADRSIGHAELIVAAADAVADELGLDEVATVVEYFAGARQIVREIDGRLLGRCRERLQRELNSQEKQQLRARFIERCRQRLPVVG